MNEPVKCYYTLGGINYKNGFVTSCPQQSDQLYIIEDGKSIKPSDIINSEGFRKHRKEMMAGNWSTGCHLCKDVEAAKAGHSMRLDYPADTSTYNEDTGEIDLSAVKHVELRFSNACNMACLHCSDVYSSGWMSKLKYYQADQEDRDHGLIQLTRRMHRASDTDTLSIDLDIDNMTEIVNDINANFPNIEKVDFAGGEVLYQKQFFPCLELLAKHPNKDNMTICFHSNFNAKADMGRLYELLLPFGGMKSYKDTVAREAGATIMMSLDSGKNIYPYFRTGDWEVLKKNVETFKAHDKDKKFDLFVVCTTSAYQIMDLVDVFQSILELDVTGINSSIVYTPRYINPALMMIEHKDSVLADIKAVKQLIMDEKVKRFKNLQVETQRRSWNSKYKIFTDLSTAQKAIENIERYVTYNNTSTAAEYEALKVYIRKSDSIWKQSFNNHFVKYKFIDGQIKRVAE
jgi:MoaA/NifB/PqqE/SkfB family radical SAM enzyme